MSLSTDLAFTRRLRKHVRARVDDGAPAWPHVLEPELSSSLEDTCLEKVDLLGALTLRGDGLVCAAKIAGQIDLPVIAEVRDGPKNCDDLGV